MPEIINCPSCRRKLQVPETLLGQDVQCPTCSATFVATVGSSAPPPPPPIPREEPPARRRPRDDEDEDDEYEERKRRRMRRDLAPHRGVLVLVLGILSIPLGRAYGIGIIPGIIAWVIGSQDLREIRAGRMDPEGQGMSQAGFICGIVGTIISLLWVLYCLFIAVLFFVSLAASAAK